MPPTFVSFLKAVLEKQLVKNSYEHENMSTKIGICLCDSFRLSSKEPYAHIEPLLEKILSAFAVKNTPLPPTQS